MNVPRAIVMTPASASASAEGQGLCVCVSVCICVGLSILLRGDNGSSKDLHCGDKNELWGQDFVPTSHVVSKRVFWGQSPRKMVPSQCPHKKCVYINVCLYVFTAIEWSVLDCHLLTKWCTRHTSQQKENTIVFFCPHSSSFKTKSFTHCIFVIFVKIALLTFDLGPSAKVILPNESSYVISYISIIQM